MSVALLFISHQHVASHLLALTESLHAEPMHNCSVIEVPLDAPVEAKLADAHSNISDLRLGDGMIIITDMFGGTPSNIAHALARKYHAPLVSGLSLPMLMRIYNYRDSPLPTLLDKAISGGQQGVMLHTCEEE